MNAYHAVKLARHLLADQPGATVAVPREVLASLATLATGSDRYRRDKQRRASFQTPVRFAVRPKPAGDHRP